MDRDLTCLDKPEGNEEWLTAYFEAQARIHRMLLDACAACVAAYDRHQLQDAWQRLESLRAVIYRLKALAPFARETAMRLPLEALHRAMGNPIQVLTAQAVAAAPLVMVPWDQVPESVKEGGA